MTLIALLLVVFLIIFGGYFAIQAWLKIQHANAEMEGFDKTQGLPPGQPKMVSICRPPGVDHAPSMRFESRLNPDTKEWEFRATGSEVCIKCGVTLRIISPSQEPNLFKWQ